MKLDDEEPWGDRLKEKGLKWEGEVSDREKAKCVWESFGAEVHCGRADSVSGGSEVWINASDWRRAAAVVREQNITRREKREREERREDGNERIPAALVETLRLVAHCKYKKVSSTLMDVRHHLLAAPNP
ncbi:hypothetical protein PAMP_019038 [Pampus punctatissimus]